MGILFALGGSWKKSHRLPKSRYICRHVEGISARTFPQLLEHYWHSVTINFVVGGMAGGDELEEEQVSNGE